MTRAMNMIFASKIFFLDPYFCKRKSSSIYLSKKTNVTGAKEFLNGSLNDSAISIQHKNLINQC